MAKTGILQPINITPGVQPTTDMPASATKHYTYADKIRFWNGVPRKIGGWISTAFSYGETVQGTIRTIFSAIINGKVYTVLGTNKKLYSVIGSVLTNITPLKTVSVPAADSLDTHYGTLANNPFSAISGSSFVTVADTQASLFKVGDTVTFSGTSGFAGISAGSFNTSHVVRDIGVNLYTINVGTAANATTTGGGASVVRKSGLITLNSTAHGNIAGDRVKVEGATDTGGILAADINAEHIIRNVLTDSFDFMTDGTASSSVSAGGGAATVYYEEIPAGSLNETVTQGYGAGLYGAGLYGTALTSSVSRTLPRIWFADRYANTMVMTPGNQTGVYQWFGENDTAPELVANAPTAVNYVFVSDNILVTLGAGGIENRIFASDQNDIEEWTSSSTNQVFDDDTEGAGRFLSHVPASDYNLLFTENSTYTFRYIGLPLIWEIKLLDDTIGIIAPMARVNAKSVAFWMGLENFYMFRGGVVEVIPANTQAQSTCLSYVFGDLNYGQKSKIFGWYNQDFNEVWFHYPSSNSNECDRVVVVNLLDYTWVPHTLGRTAAEYPGAKLKNPRLANVGDLYQHELGTDDDDEALSWTLTGPKTFYAKENVNLNAIIPDSVQTEDITFTNDGYLFPQSPVPTTTNSLTISPTTTRLPLQAMSRYHQYTWEGSELGQEWLMGMWLEEIQKGATE